MEDTFIVSVCYYSTSTTYVFGPFESYDDAVAWYEDNYEKLPSHSEPSFDVLNKPELAGTGQEVS